MKETAKVRGNIYSPIVCILEGACFSGNIDMDAKTPGQFSVKQDLSGPRTIKPTSSAA